MIQRGTSLITDPSCCMDLFLDSISQELCYSTRGENASAEVSLARFVNKDLLLWSYSQQLCHYWLIHLLQENVCCPLASFPFHKA